MKKLLFFAFFLLAAVSGFSQVKITEMTTYTGNPDGGWVPVVISGTNRKIDPAYIGRDSIAVVQGSTYDTLKWYHNSVYQYYKLVRAGGTDGNNYPTGLSFAGGTLTLTRNGLADLTTSISIPEQVNLTAGSNITITGTYPNLTIASTAGGAGVTDGDKGDITVSGTGSTYTIDNNVVTDAKIRQSAGLSVIGRSAGTTGNVADITATTSGQVLGYNGTALVWDSADYAKLKNTPQVNPGTYIAPGDVFNPGFLVLASAIVRPSNTFVHGTSITWEILNNATNHNWSFIDSVYGNSGTNQLSLRYPNVKNVLNVTVTDDESFSPQLIIPGPTVSLTVANVSVYRPRQVGIRLRGAGTTTWTKSNSLGTTANWDVTTFSTSDGSTSFNVTTTTATEYEGLNIQYIGPNGYSIKRVYSGLGAYNVKFILQDAFGNPVTTAPTSSDEIIITGAGMDAQQVGMATWNTLTNSWMGTSTNFWVWGAFEAYMVAAPVSSTSIQVRWQSYPSATQYKIYRATSLYGTRTLIYTGTAFRYDDSGLSASTKYYYFMYATVSGVDTFVTSFNTNTYQ